MKKLGELPLDLAERLELPEEVVLGSGKLTVTGERRVLAENHRSILEYSPEHIVVAFARGKASINGTALCLNAMNGRELLISGRIQSVEWS